MSGHSGGFGSSTAGSSVEHEANFQMGGDDSRWQICETCLGPNPFVRILKMPMSRECKISARPYTAYRFRPGRDARYKETIICYEVAVAKNVCQCCLFDMKFQLPTAVVDKFMRDAAEQVKIPESDVGRDYYWQQQIAAQNAAGPAGLKLTGGADPSGALLKLTRNNPYYERNRAKICSFWLGGTCKRVIEGTCPYRPCNGDFRFPELNGQKEMASKLIGDLKTDGAAKVQKLMDRETRAHIKMSISGNRDEKIKNRYHGKTDALAEKIFARVEEKMGGAELKAPEDMSITTLWVGGVVDIRESELRDIFYAHGEISGVKMVPKSKCAFITYTTRAGAELAAERLHNKIVIKGKRLRMQWGKPASARPIEAGVATGGDSTAAAGGKTYSGTAPAPVGSGKVNYASMSANSYGSKIDRA